MVGPQVPSIAEVGVAEAGADGGGVVVRDVLGQGGGGLGTCREQESRWLARGRSIGPSRMCLQVRRVNRVWTCPGDLGKHWRSMDTSVGDFCQE